jgi:hypothetical protein
LFEKRVIIGGIVADNLFCHQTGLHFMTKFA